eukprot:Gb_37254 [translate_table: standard]
MILSVGLLLRLQGRKTTTSAFKTQCKANNGSVSIFCKQGRLNEALNTIYFMDQPAESSVYACLFLGCVNEKAQSEGKLVHAHMIETGFKPDISLRNKLLSMYTKCGNLVDARRVLDQMIERDVVSWTIMVAAYAKHGFAEEASTLFYQMQRTGILPNQFTYASVLQACANLSALDELHDEIVKSGYESNVFVGTALVNTYSKFGCIEKAHNMKPNSKTFTIILASCASLEALEQGKEIHEDIIRSGLQSDVFVGSALVDMYAKCGCMEQASQAFDKMPQRDVVSWTAMIAAYTSHGHAQEALTLFYKMQKTGIQPNHFTFSSVLPACAKLADVKHGELIHEEIIRSGLQSNVFVGNALVDMYAKCGRINNARKLFDKMPQQNVVSWNAMVAGYAQNGLVDEALKLFDEVPERNEVSWNAMIAGYIQNGHVADALKLFKKMPNQDVVSWTTMIAGYAQNGHGEEAFKLFRQMQLAGVKPNLQTFAIVLPACANLAALEQGKEVHEVIIRSGFHSDIFVGSALVDMYAKCGTIEFARTSFDKMNQRDVVSWSAMILGYAMHGCAKEALQLFQKMQHSGTKPDHVTFVGVLTACCHAGLVDEGWQYFHCMSRYNHITPRMEHYGCMVDLLGRTGHLDEAQHFIKKMPIKPDATVWASLLGACRIYAHIELGERVAEYLFELDPKNATPYVMLSNIYAAAGRWDDIEKVRKIMKDKRVEKKPGCSWIEVNRQVHVFSVGDRSHPQMEKIYSELERLSRQMRTAGYVPDTRFVLNDVEEEQKEQILCHHSEKLAIVFGLINTSPGTAIRIIKNLRVCGDCHSATKFISKIVAREIVLNLCLCNNKFMRILGLALVAGEQILQNLYRDMYFNSRSGWMMSSTFNSTHVKQALVESIQVLLWSSWEWNWCHRVYDGAIGISALSMTSSTMRRVANVDCAWKAPLSQGTHFSFLFLCFCDYIGIEVVTTHKATG